MWWEKVVERCQSGTSDADGCSKKNTMTIVVSMGYQDAMW
jgi:hypothetical protein